MARYFECPIQCFSVAFDVLIKISESYQPQIPSVGSGRVSQRGSRTEGLADPSMKRGGRGNARAAGWALSRARGTDQMDWAMLWGCTGPEADGVELARKRA